MSRATIVEITTLKEVIDLQIEMNKGSDCLVTRVKNGR